MAVSSLLTGVARSSVALAGPSKAGPAGGNLAEPRGPHPPRKTTTMTNSSTVLVTGNTYPVKDAIKALGGRWDAVAKGWRVPADKADSAKALVASGRQLTPRHITLARSYGRPRSLDGLQLRLDRWPAAQV